MRDSFICSLTMSTEWSGTIHPETDIRHLNAIVNKHVIVHPPPWNVETLLQPFLARPGRRIQLVLHHNSRLCSIVDTSIHHQVLQTTVQAFQHHRLSAVVSNPIHRLSQSSATPTRGSTGRATPSRRSTARATPSRRTTARGTPARAPTTRAYETVVDAVPSGASLMKSLPSESSPTSPSTSHTTCTLCLTPIPLQQLERLSCTHSYHRRCLHQWLMHNQSCPFCGTNIP